MLAEFALTPHLFDEASQQDNPGWRDQLAELARTLFPRNAPLPVIIADLQAGSWSRFSGLTIGRIRDQNVRFDVQKLLERLVDVSVRRPACGGNCGRSEMAWGHEAVQSAGQSEIDRIVVSDACHPAIATDHPRVHPLAHVSTDGFWQGVPHSGHVPRELQEQLRVLRPILHHAEFIWFASPYIEGTTTDDTIFGEELLRAAYGRPFAFPPPTVELHTKAPDSQSSEYPRLMAAQRKTLTERIGRVLRTSQQVTVRFHAEWLERVLIAGKMAERTSSPPIPSPRWGVSMTHVWRPIDRGSAGFNEWKLLNAEGVRDWFKDFQHHPAETPALTITG